MFNNKIEIMKKIIIIPAMLLLIVIGSAFKNYSNPQLIMAGESLSNGKKLPYVNITVVYENKHITRYRTNKDGECVFALKLNKEYKVIYSKPGYESKLINVNANVKKDFDKEAEFFYSIDLKKTSEAYPEPKLVATLLFSGSKLQCNDELALMASKEK